MSIYVFQAFYISSKHSGVIKLIKNRRCSRKFLKTLSSSSIFALPNYTTFGQIHSGATVPLKLKL
jgi:hypothetical protein